MAFFIFNPDPSRSNVSRCCVSNLIGFFFFILWSISVWSSNNNLIVNIRKGKGFFQKNKCKKKPDIRFRSIFIGTITYGRVGNGWAVRSRKDKVSGKCGENKFATSYVKRQNVSGLLCTLVTRRRWIRLTNRQRNGLEWTQRNGKRE